jgi:hypothetical protein
LTKEKLDGNSLIRKILMKQLMGHKRQFIYFLDEIPAIHLMYYAFYVHLTAQDKPEGKFSAIEK